MARRYSNRRETQSGLRAGGGTAGDIRPLLERNE
jgi:hypothetical protein